MKRLNCLLIVLIMLFSSIAFNTSAKEYTIDEMADFLSKLEILHGDSSKDGSYDYYSLLTRAQFTKLAVAASNYKNLVPLSTNTSPYSDVQRTHWAAGYIKVAVNNKLISGYPDSTYRPEAPVLLEEAVTIALKLLGYENSDFGGEWPNGQMGIAKNINLLDDIGAYQGSQMTRSDAIILIYNTINAKTKSGAKYIDTLGYSKIEDAVLIASSKEDSNLDANKVSTSEGIFKIDEKSFNFGLIGQKGDLILKNKDEILAFYPSTNAAESYVIAGVLGTDIFVDINGSAKKLDIKSDTVAYYNSQKVTYATLAGKVSVGDFVSVIKDSYGNIKHILINAQDLAGPITVTSYDVLNSFNGSDLKIIKSGGRVTLNDITINDIIYYSKPLNTIYVYSDKKTGIYEEALPNQEFPNSIILSGKTYELEGSQAFSKLSSNGKYKYGDFITVLLGKDGKIADVASNEHIEGSVYAYVLNSGSKEFEFKGETYTSYYINVVTPDGNVYEYATSKDYKEYRSKVVRIEFENSIAKATLINDKSNLSGEFNLSNMLLGSSKISKDIKIIDVKGTDSTRAGEFIKVYPARLDKVKIDSSKVLYYHKNESNEIDKLILHNVTGDCYQYGIMVKASLSKGSISTSGSYTYLIDGKETSANVNAGFSIKARTPAKLDISGGQLKGASELRLLEEGIANVYESYLITTNKEKYILSDKVSVYYLNSDYDYVMIPLSEVIKSSEYKLSAYYDSKNENGGRIRIIIARKN